MRVVATCLALSGLLKLVLQFLIVRTQPVDDVLLFLIDLSELLVFLVVFLQLHQLLLLILHRLGEFLYAVLHLLFQARHFACLH